VKNIQPALTVQPRRRAFPPAAGQGAYLVVYGRLSNDRICPKAAPPVSACSQMICHYAAEPNQSGPNRVIAALFTESTLSTGGDETPLLCRFVVQRACAGCQRGISLHASLPRCVYGSA
jgi:hypothetical protein